MTLDFTSFRILFWTMSAASALMGLVTTGTFSRRNTLSSHPIQYSLFISSILFVAAIMTEYQLLYFDPLQTPRPQLRSIFTSIKSILYFQMAICTTFVFYLPSFDKVAAVNVSQRLKYLIAFSIAHFIPQFVILFIQVRPKHLAYYIDIPCFAMIAIALVRKTCTICRLQEINR